MAGLLAFYKYGNLVVEAKEASCRLRWQLGVGAPHPADRDIVHCVAVGFIRGGRVLANRAG